MTGPRLPWLARTSGPALVENGDSDVFFRAEYSDRPKLPMKLEIRVSGSESGPGRAELESESAQHRQDRNQELLSSQDPQQHA
jgi:hypothetical protein